MPHVEDAPCDAGNWECFPNRFYGGRAKSMAQIRTRPASSPIMPLISPRFRLYFSCDLFEWAAYTHGRQYPSIAAWDVYSWIQRLGRALEFPSHPKTAAFARDRMFLWAPSRNNRSSIGQMSRSRKLYLSERSVALSTIYRSWRLL